MNRYYDAYCHHGSQRRSIGFTLIELMVAMLLGLIVIAGVSSVFLANLRSYHSNTALSDVQTNSRIAFELLSRDIREAGNAGCGAGTSRVANVLNGGNTLWYADWNNPVHGYADASTDPALSGITGNGAPVAGKPSLHVISTGGIEATVSGAPSGTAANLKINQPTGEINDGDILIVCSLSGINPHATIFQVTSYKSKNITVVHNTGKGSPGNCSKGLDFPTLCTTNGNSYIFPPNSPIAKLSAVDWYIGHNPDGGTSLYRLSVTDAADVDAMSPQEMVRNVSDMELLYHQSGSTNYVAADSGSLSNWAAVDAVRVTLELQSANHPRAGTDGKPIERGFSTTTTIRNRVQ